MGVTIGPLHVRRSIFIRAAAERVWQEFKSFERRPSARSLRDTVRSMLGG